MYLVGTYLTNLTIKYYEEEIVCMLAGDNSLPNIHPLSDSNSKM